ncbi:Homeodomain-interacting protein kinase 1 [Liparis tanakae]|uniref:Homeodomain-interacting protein kinase 1 n=1 Tax=Liparis tanakae TaxID=230148 RepID=A0A4Z2EGJ5_9TELE|nr:Homeodomain-interacting protein kinase 1 [Liparis tanakae]
MRRRKPLHLALQKASRDGPCRNVLVCWISPAVGLWFLAPGSNSRAKLTTELSYGEHQQTPRWDSNVSPLMALTMAEAPSNQNRVFIGDLLSSGTSSYVVESVLGQGTFGMVAKCRNIADNKAVAIKMMPNHGSLVEQARAVVDVLFQLQLLDSDKGNLVQ